MWKLKGSKLTLREMIRKTGKEYRHAEKHTTMMGTGLRNKAQVAT